MKNKTKNIKIALLSLSLILIYVVGSIVLKSYIANSEIKKFNSQLQKEKKFYTLNKVYLQKFGSTEVIEGVRENSCYRVHDSLSKCLKYDEVKVLSTNDDQDLLRTALIEKYKFYYNKNELAIEFQDLNLDGIEDLLLFYGGKPKDGHYYQYVNLYSAHNNKLIWQIENMYDDFLYSLLDVRFLKYENQPPTVVIYNEANRPHYQFYKPLNGVYQEVLPSMQDWSDYWKEIKFKNILVNKILGVWGLLAIIIVFIYLIIPAFLVILFIRIIKFIRKS